MLKYLYVFVKLDVTLALVKFVLLVRVSTFVLCNEAFVVLSSHSPEQPSATQSYTVDIVHSVKCTASV